MIYYEYDLLYPEEYEVDTILSWLKPSEAYELMADMDVQIMAYRRTPLRVF